ncbi:unnamed protein product [Dovyalis caffra]|uniref:RNA-binding S4 domain-containing protein n=1 Tax=Dovyalis caffra TaxID=77055 RepID=A0AAV1SFE6_9ROSI|nr:unnamed protein product [Dovyalis caffra]
MAVQHLKLPIIISRFASIRWVKPEIQCSPFRSFAAAPAAKTGKFQLPKKKRRLDEICLERFQQYSRTFIQSWILQGKVFVDGKVVNKAGTPVSEKSVVEINAEVPKYVCRAGYKLEAAIEQLGVAVAGKVALDSGLSTGGFTDCLLQYGASFVYGVDVGYGQVADKVRRDERVCVIERTNLRYLSELPQKVDLVTLDLSFISIILVMPAIVNVMKEEATLVTLVKPQFEARRSQVLEKITTGVENFGFRRNGWIESPLKGAEGNIEFLVHFNRIPEKSLQFCNLSIVYNSHQDGQSSCELLIQILWKSRGIKRLCIKKRFLGSFDEELKL